MKTAKLRTLEKLNYTLTPPQSPPITFVESIKSYYDTNKKSNMVCKMYCISPQTCQIINMLVGNKQKGCE